MTDARPSTPRELLDAIAARASGPFLSVDGTWRTWADLDRGARVAAGLLRALGVPHSGRVCSALPPSWEGIVALLGAYRIGATWVPLNPAAPWSERAPLLADTRPDLLLADDHHPLPVAYTGPVLDTAAIRAALTDRPPAVAEADAEPDDVALIVFTSGTTGRSKGVELTHRAVLSAIGALMGAWEVSKDDTIVLALPLFHVHGLCAALHGALITGARVHLIPRFAPETVAAAMEAGGTVFMGVPTMYRRLMDWAAGDAGRLAGFRRARLLVSGSAALPPALAAVIRAQTGQEVLERYGMTETHLTLSNPLHGPRRPGSVGVPVPGFEVRVVDDGFADVPEGVAGQLLVRGVGLMRGYLDAPEATAAAFHEGWFITGDVAIRGSEGYISLVGRASTDIIKSAGHKIGALEIEAVLRGAAGVADVAVLGVPDVDLGERVVAAIVPITGTHPRIEDLDALVRASLSPHKRVRAYAVVPDLARNAMGKPLKTAMRHWVFAEVGARTHDAG